VRSYATEKHELMQWGVRLHGHEDSGGCTSTRARGARLHVHGRTRLHVHLVLRVSRRRNGEEVQLSLDTASGGCLTSFFQTPWGQSPQNPFTTKYEKLKA
jgi:hypothetical protein